MSSETMSANTFADGDSFGSVRGWVIFAGSAAALVTAAAIGVLVGAQLERLVKPQTLKLIAGIGFIAIGAWTIFAR